MQKSPLKDDDLLANAWYRLLSSTHIPYKSFLRTEIEAFGSAHQELLNLIYGRIQAENYAPQTSYKVHVPKSEYASRTFIILSVSDWVVYSAIVTLVSESAMRTRKILYNTRNQEHAPLFSNLPRYATSGRPRTFFVPWQKQYKRFNDCSKAYVEKGFPYLAEIDLTAFYDLIDHRLLRQKICSYYDDVYSLDLLEELLTSWASGNPQSAFQHGLPQGPEASAYLADLFLYEVDETMYGKPQCRYARWVDDIRIFCADRRQAEAQVAWIDQHLKQYGLVINPRKTRVIDAREDTSWLKEESSAALALTSDYAERPKGKSRKDRIHTIAKSIFLTNCDANAGDNNATHLVRLTLPRLMPDREVTQQVLAMYSGRADLYDMIFVYLKECSNDPKVVAFCWDELSKIPIRDWENMSLLEVVQRSTLKAMLTEDRIALLRKYQGLDDMPLCASRAGAILLKKTNPKAIKPILDQLPKGALYFSIWGPPALRLKGAHKTIHRSVYKLLKHMMSANDDRLSLLGAYFVSSEKVHVPQRLVGSQYGRALLGAHGVFRKPETADEIAPLLRRYIKLPIQPNYDFRRKLASLQNMLYEKALSHLRIALRYIDTNPTYFVNNMHNVNHLLLHYALHKGGYVSRAIPLRDTFRELGPRGNSRFQGDFPGVTTVFREWAKARNTNRSSHPYDDVHRRFARWITYKTRDRLLSNLRTAYKEFMRNTANY